MDKINHSPLRIGRFTSSEIYKLVKSGRAKDEIFSAAGKKYIRQVKHERRRKRTLKKDVYTRDITWGNLMELRVYDMIGLEWSIESKETKIHPKYPFWAGTKDLIVPGEKVGEIKGYQPEKFCEMAEVLFAQDLESFKKDFPAEYWQIVSNACIEDVPRGESLLYQPYDSESQDIAELCDRYENIDEMYLVKTIQDDILSDRLDRLAFQPDSSEYPNIITFEFEIPNEDKEFITERIIRANELQ